jgi:hypothetical protein
MNLIDIRPAAEWQQLNPGHWPVCALGYLFLDPVTGEELQDR